MRLRLQSKSVLKPRFPLEKIVSVEAQIESYSQLQSVPNNNFMQIPLKKLLLQILCQNCQSLCIFIFFMKSWMFLEPARFLTTRVKNARQWNTNIIKNHRFARHAPLHISLQVTAGVMKQQVVLQV